MLAYYVMWRMNRDLAPMPSNDDDLEAAAVARIPVAKAKVRPLLVATPSRDAPRTASLSTASADSFPSLPT